MFIEIPDCVSVEVEGTRSIIVHVSGPKGEIEREFICHGVSIKKSTLDRWMGIEVEASSKRKEKIALVGTFASHIKNMVEGVTNGFEYKLRIVYSHFPIQAKVEGENILISNFLGERKPRKAKIFGKTNVEIEGDEIIVSGISKEDVGQTAANVELATKIKRRDPRVFQDGIYIIEKAGKHV
jgi:large subunit ribosomal protein L6